MAPDAGASEPGLPTLHELRLRWGGDAAGDGAGETPIRVGPGALPRSADRLAPWLEGRTLFVVAQPPVLEVHGTLLDELTAPVARRVDLPVPDGEAAKTVAVADRLWQAMLEAGGKRDSRLLTFGGGSVGDLGGFVAGCFLRGIDYVQLPTTLLAQVDAAIGGKTAVDLTGGKNTVGLFHHPAAVVADTSVLATLPVGELRAGLVESIKMALILDGPLFLRIEDDLDALLAGDALALSPVVAASAAAKVGVVESDVREAGRRRLLNLGHTLGHAIESTLGYAGLRHGEAVAYGLLFVLRLAERRGLHRADPDLFPRTRRLLARLGLPPLPVADLDPDDLVERLGRDKKAREEGLAWILPAALEPGSAAGEGVAAPTTAPAEPPAEHPLESVPRAEGRIVRDVTPDEVRRELEPFLADPFAPAA